MDQLFHYNNEDHLDQMKSIVEKVYGICGDVNKDYVDELILDYDEIFAICDEKNKLKSIAIFENKLDMLNVKLVCSVSKGGTGMIKKCVEIAESRGYSSINLESIHRAYGFYRKMGFKSDSELLDSTWDKFSINSINTNIINKKKVSTIGKRISHNSKNRATILLDRIPLENKIHICVNEYGGDARKMFLDISENIPKDLICMRKIIN